MAVYWYVCPAQTEAETLQPILHLPCSFNMNSSSTRIHHEPRIAQDLLLRNPGQAVIEVETNTAGIGLVTWIVRNGEK